MKQFTTLLLLLIAFTTNAQLKLKDIEKAPGAGYVPYTNGSGVQTYSLLSTVAPTATINLQQAVNASPTLSTSVLAQSPDANTFFVIENDNATMSSANLTYAANTVVTPTQIETTVLGPVNQSYHYVTDGYIENTTPLLTYNGNTVATTNQLPVLTASTGITISGTTPNYTLSATGSGSTTVLTASTNITIAGTAPNYTISTPTQTTGLASLTGVETLTNKRITIRTTTTTTTPTITVNSDSFDMVAVTTLSTATTFTAPTGTPTEGQTLVYRIKDNATARALTFNSVFRFSSDVPAPTTTIVSKWMYIYFMYNLTDAKWDCLTIATNY